MNGNSSVIIVNMLLNGEHIFKQLEQIEAQGGVKMCWIIMGWTAIQSNLDVLSIWLSSKNSLVSTYKSISIENEPKYSEDWSKCYEIWILRYLSQLLFVSCEVI